jgi:hypothetical protein
MRVDYDGRVFRSTGGPGDPSKCGSPGQSGSGQGDVVGRYHQRGELVWGEFDGGRVLEGRLVGRCRPDGSVEFAYCQVLDGGEIVAGRCVSTPHRRAGGRIALEERYRRMDGTSGVSWIEEVQAPRPAVRQA